MKRREPPSRFSRCPSASSSRPLAPMLSEAPTSLRASPSDVAPRSRSPASSPSRRSSLHVCYPHSVCCRPCPSPFSCPSRPCCCPPPSRCLLGFSTTLVACPCVSTEFLRGTSTNPDPPPRLCTPSRGVTAPSASSAPLPCSLPLEPALSPILCLLSGRCHSFFPLTTSPLLSPRERVQSRFFPRGGHCVSSVLHRIVRHTVWFLVYLFVLTALLSASPSASFFPFSLLFCVPQLTTLSAGRSSPISSSTGTPLTSLPGQKTFQGNIKYNSPVSLRALRAVSSDTSGLPISKFFSTGLALDPGFEASRAAPRPESFPCDFSARRCSFMCGGETGQICRGLSGLFETSAEDRSSPHQGKDTGVAGRRLCSPAAFSAWGEGPLELQREACLTRPSDLSSKFSGQSGKSGQIRTGVGNGSRNVFSLLFFGEHLLLFASAVSVPASLPYKSLRLSSSLFPEFPNSCFPFSAFSARRRERDPFRQGLFSEHILAFRGGYNKDREDETADSAAAEATKQTTAREKTPTLSPPHSASGSASQRGVTRPTCTASPSVSSSFPRSPGYRPPETTEAPCRSLDVAGASGGSQRVSGDEPVPGDDAAEGGPRGLQTGRRPRIVRGSDLFQGRRGREKKPQLRFVASGASMDAGTRGTASCGPRPKRRKGMDEVEELELEDENDVRIVVSPSALRSLLLAPSGNPSGVFSRGYPPGVALLYGVVLPEEPSPGQQEEDTCAIHACGRDALSQLSSRTAEKRRKRKLVLRVEAAVVLPYEHSDGENSGGPEEEPCQGAKRIELGAEGLKKLEEVVSSSSPARAAADRVAAHLGLRLLGWASLRPPRIRSSDLDVKSDGDEDKKKAGKNELSLRWKERRREGARQIVYGRREKSESEDARGPEARRGSEGGTEEERSQDKPAPTTVTPAEVLLTMVLQTQQNQSAANASPSPARSAILPLRRDGSVSLSSPCSPSPPAPPLIGLVVHREIARVPQSGGLAGVHQTFCHPGRLEIEAFTSTRHGRRVFESGLLPAISAVPSEERGQDKDDTNRHLISRADKNSRSTLSLKPLKRDGDGSVPKGYSPRSSVFSGCKPKRVEGRDVFSKEKAKQEEEERKLLAKAFELTGPVEVDGLSYTHLPAEFFFRFLPVSAGGVPSSDRAHEQQGHGWRDQAPAGSESAGRAGFQSKEEGQGTEYVSVFVDDADESVHGPEERAGCWPPVTQEDVTTRLKEILRAQLPSSLLLRHLRSFPLLTEVAGLLHNNDRDLQVICDALKKSSMAPSSGMSQTSVTEGRDERGNWTRVEVTTAASPEIPLRIIRLLQALLDADTPEDSS